GRSLARTGRGVGAGQGGREAARGGTGAAAVRIGGAIELGQDRRCPGRDGASRKSSAAQRVRTGAGQSPARAPRSPPQICGGTTGTCKDVGPEQGFGAAGCGARARGSATSRAAGSGKSRGQTDRSGAAGASGAVRQAGRTG